MQHNQPPHPHGGGMYPQPPLATQNNTVFQPNLGGNQFAVYPPNGFAENSQDNLDDEDSRNMREIEKELEHSLDENSDDESSDDAVVEVSAPSRAQVPFGAMPVYNGTLSAHAKEFWFPECRNCTCCQGYKHGCKCCVGGVNTCQDSGCVDAEFSNQVNKSLAERANHQVASPTHHKTSSGTAPHASAAPADMCKFEMTPAGCRFGSSCRFKHAKAVPTSPGGPPVAHSTSSENIMYPPMKTIRCMYFARGNCMFGDNCKYGHF